MVLQGVGNTASDGFSDSPAPSDTDPYASSSSSPSTSSSSARRFDDSQLRKPAPIIGTLMGYNAHSSRRAAEQLIWFVEQKVRRPLTPEEAQAFASHSYDASMVKYRFALFGTAVGAWKFYKTTPQNRFPFVTLDEQRVERVLSSFLRGVSPQQLRRTAYGFRLMTWLCVGNLIARGVGFVVAQPIVARNAAQDPRLARFGVDLVAAQGGRAPGRPVQRNPDGTPVLPPHAGAPRWPAPRRAPAPTPAATSDDGMSPSTSGDDWSSSGYGNDSTLEQQQQPRPRPPIRSPQPLRPQSRQQQEEDDMSPTGGLFEEEVQSQARPGESTWDRLRRGESSAPGQRPPPSRRPEVPRRGPVPQSGEGGLGDSFTFAESEEERRRAQEQAQREFDARIERERQGRDFGGEERRW
ncbi:uncharacterized protein EI97DRAFT_430663 [Westerdykella ornata]|uniref:Uncharacterized protein n=1 Tax=Westerdykella ornata TaxID=318751 RepID=A0A6A6JX41_WESOR|nr:uncharacterized protein EI97DRAFT_430663 [Westerdykella ornata]KAF2279629.1 hypothetical protein EI97DRAFT_430663 [Westerdykella ornata]